MVVHRRSRLGHDVPVGVYHCCYTLGGKLELKLYRFRPGLTPFLAISGGDGLAEPSHTTLMQNILHMGIQFIHLM